MTLSEGLCCCCLDVGAGSVLVGLYTSVASVVFLAVGVEEIVLVNKRFVAGQDVVTLTALYGLLAALSVLYAVASVALVLGAARKMRSYVVPWLLLTPFWTASVVAAQVVLPLEFSHAVRLSDSTTAVVGAAIVLVLNILSVICVSLLLYVFVKTPRAELKSRGVVESLSDGFKRAGRGLRQTLRPKSKPQATYSSEPARDGGSVRVVMTDLTAPVVLRPSALEVVRSSRSEVKARSAAKSSRHDEDSLECHAEVGDAHDLSLTMSQQLGPASTTPGLDNPSFAIDDDD